MLPIPSYFEQSMHNKEIATMFKGPLYVGHVSMIPEVGDYKLLPWDNGQYIFHADDGYFLMSNICSHRQATILQEPKGNLAGPVVCKIHGWTYSHQGDLIGAPKFDGHECKHKLKRTPLSNVGGLLFTSDVPMDAFDGFGLEMNKFQFHSGEAVEYNFNWKTFLEVYGEDYHVDPFHPSLSSSLDTSSLKWKMGRGYHTCTIDGSDNSQGPWARYQKEVAEFYSTSPTPNPMMHSAVWHFFYPNLLVEFYPGSMVVAYMHPISPEKCALYTDFFYHDEINSFEPNLVQAHINAYQDTAAEDDEICKRIHEGRKSLFARGLDEFGPAHEHLEAGTLDFYDFYKKQMDAR